MSATTAATYDQLGRRAEQPCYLIEQLIGSNRFHQEIVAAQLGILKGVSGDDQRLRPLLRRPIGDSHPGASYSLEPERMLKTTDSI